jgi:hypothetical protein
MFSKPLETITLYCASFFIFSIIGAGIKTSKDERENTKNYRRLAESQRNTIISELRKLNQR